MDPNEAATWQAWAAVAQAISATIALAVGVGVPIWQRKSETKVRLKIEQGFVWYQQSKGQKVEIFSAREDSLTRFKDSYDTRHIAIRIQNDNSFPVEIVDIGTTRKKKSNFYSFHHYLKYTSIGKMPIEINPLGSATIAFDKNSLDDEGMNIKPILAYATLGNGEMFMSKKGVWNKIKRLSI
ncbi:MAG: hypothetical protein ABF751_11160 [Acetobacter orientalis]|uniref:hypothetical protein n=1 Tax=Acetobacter orientalis TaxID=146474 RepID=UPI0039E73D2E